jgi:hypothetical protein
MAFPKIATVGTADEARDIAISHSHRNAVAESYSDLFDYGTYFEALAGKFPELREEFIENGII